MGKIHIEKNTCQNLYRIIYIGNLIENRKFNSKTETDFEFIMLLKENLPPKIHSYGNILPRNYLSYMFKFQLVPFAFSLILGDSFMVSPPQTKVWGNGRRDFFPKNAFHGETNFV